jgi:hypothetical protein
MEAGSKATATSTRDAPLDDFSQCHAGIVSHLAQFARLPALLEPAAEARRIADEIVRFFRAAVFEHHAEEEQELFPAVLASAAPGEERTRVQEIVDRLTWEHREIERTWRKLEPALKQIANGRDAELDADAVDALVRGYATHAAYEEDRFLPLSQAILGRNSRHMAALGLSLHMRHALPKAIRRYGGLL